MTIKTPQEVAAEQMAAFTIEDGDVQECSVGFIADAIAEAIEADRKQRAADLEKLTDAAASWAAELTDYIIPASREVGDDDSAESQELERDELQAALGRYLNEEEIAS